MPRFRIDDLSPFAPPAGEQALKEWNHAASSAPRVLVDLLRREDVLVHASGPSFLIVGALAPRSSLSPPDWGDLEDGLMPYPSPGWTIEYMQSAQERSIQLQAPLSTGTSKSFQGGEPLYFLRSMEGMRNAPTSIEISQKLVHALSIHHVPERKAYCRIDESNGDIQDVVRILEMTVPDASRKVLAITIRRDDLEKFMALTQTSLVLRFDFTRVPRGFMGWGNGHERFRQELDNMAFHGGSGSGGSYVNGALIVPGAKTVATLINEWCRSEEPGARQYAEFKILDWKNGRRIQSPCAPGFLSNYFQKSDLPFEISPALFRPDVLQKYKSDPEKYDLRARSIGCRGSWYLETYDVNGEGLVHTYIGYLARLPYEEQLYWQSFNVWPEEGATLQESISARAFQTDFEGSWNTTYDPVEAIKRRVQSWNESAPAWWQVRSDSLLSALHHPVTDSPKEWGDELIALDQLLVEGFLEKKLRIHATHAGIQPDPKWRSLKLLEALLARALGQDEAAAAMSGLFQVHDLRSLVKGHATGSKGDEAIRQARTEHGDLPENFRALAQRCDEALAAIEQVLLPTEFA